MTPANDLGGMDTDMHEVYFYTFECRRRFRVMDDRHGRAVCPHRPPIGDLISAGNLNKIKESHRILYHRPTATATAAPVNEWRIDGGRRRWRLQSLSGKKLPPRRHQQQQRMTVAESRHKDARYRENTNERNFDGRKKNFGHCVNKLHLDGGWATYINTHTLCPSLFCFLSSSSRIIIYARPAAVEG